MSESIFPVPPGFQPHHVRSMAGYSAMYEESVRDPEGFWAAQARRLITWSSPWQDVLRWSFDDPSVQWFSGATLNASVNCLDRHVAAGYGDEVALIWESNDPAEEPRRFTYRELLLQVERAANALRALGVRRGDRVCIYLQMVPEATISMLACARIGAIHSVVFGGYSAKALRNRISDCGARVLITQDEGPRGDKIVPMKQSADAALEGAPSIERVLVVARTGAEVPMQAGRDVFWDVALRAVEPNCIPEEMQAEDPLFILHTSGSTDKPKGLVHTTGGYLTSAAFTHQLVFDYQPGEVYWCTADVGWITGHSYVVYGPLANRATILMFEGVTSFPDHGRFWQVIERHRVNVFYTAPTALRSLMRQGDQWPAGYDLSSLRMLGTVGEPIKPPEWHWYHQVIGGGRCPIMDTWWQTETGAIMISPLPGATALKPGSATLPLPGVRPALLNDEGQVLTGLDVSGHLCMDFPWPGMARDIWGDHQRYRDTYFRKFPGRYYTGDGCRRDQDGYYWITGRVDDTIKVSGHLIGTAEVEGGIGSHLAVAEAAVVGVPDELTGQAIYAFVTLKVGQEPREGLEAEIKAAVRKAIGPHAVPKYIQLVPTGSDLPKTRSGKIMRRILREVAQGTANYGDTSTLADPAVVEVLVSGRRQ